MSARVAPGRPLPACATRACREVRAYVLNALEWQNAGRLGQLGRVMACDDGIGDEPVQTYGNLIAQSPAHLIVTLVTTILALGDSPSTGVFAMALTMSIPLDTFANTV